VPGFDEPAIAVGTPKTLRAGTVYWKWIGELAALLGPYTRWSETDLDGLAQNP
jgi:hypothetical protein